LFCLVESDIASEQEPSEVPIYSNLEPLEQLNEDQSAPCASDNPLEPHNELEDIPVSSQDKPIDTHQTSQDEPVVEDPNGQPETVDNEAQDQVQDIHSTDTVIVPSQDDPEGKLIINFSLVFHYLILTQLNLLNLLSQSSLLNQWNLLSQCGCLWPSTAMTLSQCPPTPIMMRSWASRKVI